MRYLFRELLPDSILSRESKASFNQARWTDREIQFAQSWSGRGLDTRLIEPEALRAAWLSGSRRCFLTYTCMPPGWRTMAYRWFPMALSNRIRTVLSYPPRRWGDMIVAAVVAVGAEIAIRRHGIAGAARVG